MNLKLVDERRYTPMLRRSKDGSSQTVTKILTRNLPSVCIGVTGFLFVVLPILFNASNIKEIFPAVCGGIFIGFALSGVVER